MYELRYGVGFGQPLEFDVLFYKLEIKKTEKMNYLPVCSRAGT